MSQSTGLDFPSREHTASFTLGWFREYCRSHRIETVPEFCDRVLKGLHCDDHDVHWHAIDTDLGLSIVFASAVFGIRTASIEKLWSPESGETIGDTLSAAMTPDAEAARLIELQPERRYPSAAWTRGSRGL